MSTLQELQTSLPTWLNNRELTSSSPRLLIYPNLKKMIIAMVVALVVRATAVDPTIILMAAATVEAVAAAATDRDLLIRVEDVAVAQATAVATAETRVATNLWATMVIIINLWEIHL